MNDYIGSPTFLFYALLLAGLFLFTLAALVDNLLNFRLIACGKSPALQFNATDALIDLIGFWAYVCFISPIRFGVYIKRNIINAVSYGTFSNTNYLIFLTVIIINILRVSRKFCKPKFAKMSLEIFVPVIRRIIFLWQFITSQKLFNACRSFTAPTGFLSPLRGANTPFGNEC